MCLIVPYPLGQAPSQRFRFEQYFGLIQSLFEAETHPFLTERTFRNLYRKGVLQKLLGVIWGYFRRWKLVLTIGRFDLVFIHREAAPIGPPIFEWIIARLFRKRIIYDFDDAIWMNNTSETNKFVSGFKWHRKVAVICKWSWKVSCGNHYLLDYASNYSSRVCYIPTTIDMEHHAGFVAHRHKKPVIGWTGTNTTMKYLEFILPIIRELEQEFELEFLVISNHAPTFEIASLRYCPWDKATEIADLLEMDIGLMPLKDDEWAKGKCGFKALQYMSLGIPTVLSPVGVNTSIVTDGENGFFATTPEEWKAALRKLIADPDLRKRIGENGQQTVDKRFSVHSVKASYRELLSLD